MTASINYLRYQSWYLEKMRKLPHEHTEVYKYFQEGKSVVKTNAGYFKEEAADMKLEQSIQHSKKDPYGMIAKQSIRRI